MEYLKMGKPFKSQAYLNDKKAGIIRPIKIFGEPEKRKTYYGRKI